MSSELFGPAAFASSSARYPIEVRYVDRRAEVHLWSHHRTQSVAERVWREPFYQCEALEVFIADIRSGSVLSRAFR